MRQDVILPEELLNKNNVFNKSIKQPKLKNVVRKQQLLRIYRITFLTVYHLL